MNESSMKQVSFSIAYDGPALADGTMDVRDLAPALLSVGELFDEANSVLNEDQVKFKTSIKATSTGSFEIVLFLSQTGWEQIVELFSGDSITATINIRDLIFSTGGVIWLLKKLMGRRPDKIEEMDNNSVVNIIVGDQTINISPEVRQLYENAKIHAALQKLIEEPLKRTGIDVFKSSYDNQQMTVEKSEAEYIGGHLSSEDQVIQSSRRAAFSILSITFKENNKWRLSDSHSTISAGIEDQDFLEKINRNQVSFSKGDTLICKVRTTQIINHGKIKTTHVVERVIDHITAVKQPQLDFGPEDEDGSNETD